MEMVSKFYDKLLARQSLSSWFCVILGSVILSAGFVLFMKYAMNTAIAKREEKAALKEKERAQTPEVSDNGKGGDQ